MKKVKTTYKRKKQTGSSNIEIDKKKKALAPGKRKSDSGGTYYEYRKNRSDKPGSLTGVKKKK
jgi:hypothetical protein